MPYRNARPDSPKGQVYSQFTVHGRDQALTFGKTLGLPESKLIRWLDKEWAGVTPPPATKQVTTPVPVARGQQTNRVRYKGGNVFKGRILQRGDVVWEVRWDNGTTQYVPKEHLEEY